MAKPKITRRNVPRLFRGKKPKALPGGLPKKVRARFKSEKGKRFSRKKKQKPKKEHLPELLKRFGNLSEEESASLVAGLEDEMHDPDDELARVARILEWHRSQRSKKKD